MRHIQKHIAMRSILIKTLSDIINHLGLTKYPNPFFSISDIEVSKDKTQAKVFVSFLDSQDARQHINILLDKKSEILFQLKKKKVLNNIPQISYHLDFTEAKAQHLNELIKKSNIEKK